MMVATLSLSNCAKEVDFQDRGKTDASGVPYELVVSSPTTKTTIDGFNVSWNGDTDAVNVYHAEAGSTTYVNDGSFSISSADVASGRFTGTLASAPKSGKTYDWYVFYPYVSAKTSPALINAGYTTIGSSASESQTQNGNNSTAHLAGKDFPLYGVSKVVSYDATPDVTMHHLASYIEFNVTNNTTKPLTVSEIEFDAPQNVVGTFYINFSNPYDIKYSPSGNDFVSNSATLSVINGSAIPVGESAKFYIGIKPMDIEASVGAPKKITVTVNGYEKSINLTQNASFTAGKIKTINFNYDSLVDIFTWNLTTNSYSAVSADQVTWSEDNVATMVVDKDKATTNANNYLPKDKTSTRFYENSILTFTPASGMEITKIQAEATTVGYANALRNSTWTNATASVNDKIVTIIPQDGSTSFNGVISATTGLNWVKVFYRVYVPRTLTGIVVTTAPSKTDYTVGETLDMAGAVITAEYDNATTENVTASVTTDGDEVLAHAGNAKPVTVSYQGKTATFNVNVAKASAGLSYDTASYTVAPKASFNKPVLSNPHNLTVTYSSSDESLVLVDENTGEIVIGSQVGGPVTITAATAGNDDYNAGEASYTITISTSITYYRKVTEAPAGGDWSGTYLLVSEANNAVFNGEYNGTTGAKDASVTISSSKIESSATVDAYAVTIAKSGDHYSIKYGTQYLGWASGNAARPYDDTSSNNALNDFAISGGAAIIKSAADNTRILRYNSGAQQKNGRIRYYTTNTGDVMVLYKKD